MRKRFATLAPTGAPKPKPNRSTSAPSDAQRRGGVWGVPPLFREPTKYLGFDASARGTGFGPVLPTMYIQPQLEIGRIDDRLEHEADAVADRVMRTPEPAVSRSEANRDNGERQESDPEAEEETEVGTILQRTQNAIRAASNFTPVFPPRDPSSILQRAYQRCENRASPADLEEQVPHTFESRLHNLRRGAGHPLPSDTLQFMESRFGIDFSKIRVHANGEAATLAKQVRAKAFTVGRDVVFGQGHFRPHTAEGQRLLAHELAHTVQQIGTQPVVTRPIIQRGPVDEAPELTPTPTKPRTVEEMSDDYLGAHPELVPKAESLIDDLHFHFENTKFIVDNAKIPKKFKEDAHTHIDAFLIIWRTVVEQKLFDAAIMSQWLEAGIRALRALKAALAEARKDPQFGDMPKLLLRDTKKLQGRMTRLMDHPFFQQGDAWVEEHGKRQESEARDSERKEREAQVQKGLDEIAHTSSYVWLSKTDAEIEGEIQSIQILMAFATDPLHKKVYEAHIAGLRQIQDERAISDGADDGYERVLRQGGDDPLATADALVRVALGKANANLIVLDRVLSYHYDKDTEFQIALVLSVVRRWDTPNPTWRDLAEAYAARTNVTFSEPLVPIFAADVLIHEADGDPIMLANRSLWYVYNEHPRASDLLWAVRNIASFPNGELDADFDRKYVLEVVSKWPEASDAFRRLQAQYIGGESIDTTRVVNVFFDALGEQTEDLEEGAIAAAMAYGNDTTEIAPEDLNDYLRQLPEDERRDMAKAVIARFSNSKQLQTLASSPDTRRALATLAQSLGNLTGTQHGTVWATGLDPTGLLEEYAMLETDQKFEQQFLLKIVDAMSKTQEHRYVLPGVDGSWGREVNVTTKDDGSISVFLNGDLDHYAKDRPYFETNPLQTNIFEIAPERNVVVVYPGGRSVRVPAFWLVRLSELSAQQAVKTGVEIASLVSPVGVEDLVITGAVKVFKGVKAVTAVAKGERAFGAADHLIGQLDEFAALQRGMDASDKVADADLVKLVGEVDELRDVTHLSDEARDLATDGMQRSAAHLDAIDRGVRRSANPNWASEVGALPGGAKLWVDDDLPPGKVIVEYDAPNGIVDPDSIRVVAGRGASPDFIRKHVSTITQLRRFSGWQGRARRVLLRLKSLLTGYDESVGSAMWEARLEVKKLDAIVKEELDGLSKFEPGTPEAQRAVDELEEAWKQLDDWEAVVSGDKAITEAKGHIAARRDQRHEAGLVPLRAGVPEIQAPPVTLDTPDRVASRIHSVQYTFDLILAGKTNVLHGLSSSEKTLINEALRDIKRELEPIAQEIQSLKRPNFKGSATELSNLLKQRLEDLSKLGEREEELLAKFSPKPWDPNIIDPEWIVRELTFKRSRFKTLPHPDDPSIRLFGTHAVAAEEDILKGEFIETKKLLDKPFGRYVFVILPNGELRFQHRASGVHATLVPHQSARDLGSPFRPEFTQFVRGAGEVIVENGKIVEVTNNSGHFMRGAERSADNLEAMEKQIKEGFRNHFQPDQFETMDWFVFHFGRPLV